MYRVQNTAPIHLPACNTLVSNPEWHQIRTDRCQISHKKPQIGDECVHSDGDRGRPRTRKSPKNNFLEKLQNTLRIHSGVSGRQPITYSFSKKSFGRGTVSLRCWGYEMLLPKFACGFLTILQPARPLRPASTAHLLKCWNDEVLTLVFLF